VCVCVCLAGIRAKGVIEKHLSQPPSSRPCEISKCKKNHSYIYRCIQVYTYINNEPQRQRKEKMRKKRKIFAFRVCVCVEFIDFQRINIAGGAHGK